MRLLAAGVETIENKDWLGFYRVGWLFWRGELRRLYTEDFHTQQPFLNPPYFVWACVPLGFWKSPWPPYLLCVAVTVAGSVAAVLLARRVTASSGDRTLTAAAAVVGSAPWLGCVMTGQLSGLLIGLIACSLWAWRAGRPLLAGLVLSALAIKPNIFVPLLLLLAVGRHWRVAAGALLGVAGLVLSTLPLGLWLWSDYRLVSRYIVELAFDGHLAPWMQQNLLAFWVWIGGAPEGMDLARLGWLVTAGIACAALSSSWWRTRRAEALPRLFGQAVLGTVVAIPYLFYYDGLLLAVPALVWFLDPRGFASLRIWRACGALLLLTFVWQHVQMFSHYTGVPPLVGPLCLAWLVLDVVDLHVAERRVREAPRPAS